MFSRQCIGCRQLAAEDTKILSTVNSSVAIDGLRADLQNLVSWSKEWQMLFNIDKCKVMHFGYNNPCLDYDMDGLQLQVVSEKKNLGVIISNDLKWEKHCSTAVGTAKNLV